jgi:8-oxo-dGTP pyrophosphatase MutT (NUDIX family)
MNHLYIAQKGLVLSKDRKSLLVIKYSEAKYTSDKVKGKFGLPGGKMTFGENPDESFIREVKEEAGITTKPLLPFYVWTWNYQKEKDLIQIVAIARMAIYKSGTPTKSKGEKETTIEKAE